jgi:hypothetical protein
VRVLGPNFTAGLVVRDERVVRAAPILSYMIGWPVERVVALTRRRGWTVEQQQPEAGTCASSAETGTT